MIDKEKEISIINRGKIAYLYNFSLFEDRIEQIEVEGKTQYIFIYKRTPEIIEKIIEYNNNTELKRYNSCFKNIALVIAKFKNKITA